MAILKCKMCGGDLSVSEGVSVCECEYCGTKQTVPVANDEKKLTLFARANRLRFNSEFDKAAGVYEAIVADFPEEAEAYWGLVLCQYGIEYVDDPKTGKKIPTCHRSSFESVMEDGNFELTLEYADVTAREVYRGEAKQIEELRRGIIAVSSKEEPYDIFICYKETDDKGERTIDSVIAQDVYTALTEKGYRVFFARISLEDKLGVEYEPYIFAALHSAKVMLAFGTDYEYYNAVWVKNEWSRFLQLIEKGEKKTLIPCYKGIDAYDMPKEFAKLQAQDMGKVGALQDLLRGIEKILGDASAPSGNANVGPLLERVTMFLEDKDWNNANEYCEKVLDIDPKCADAYLGKLMAEAHTSTREGLRHCAESFENKAAYQKLLRFGSDKLKAELNEYLQHIADRNRSAEYARAVSAMKNAKTQQDFIRVAEIFRSLIGHKEDASALAEECTQRAESIRKDAVYNQGVANMKQGTKATLAAAIQTFQSIVEWRDATAHIEKCQKLLEKIQEKEQNFEKEQKRKRRRKCFAIFAVSLLMLIGIFVVYPFISYQSGNYKPYIKMYRVKEFAVPDGVTEIGKEAFYGCKTLVSVTIPDSITVIHEDAFRNCSGLTSLTIPDNVVTIHEGAFFGCTSLTSVTLGKQLTDIRLHAFADCDAVKKLTINCHTINDDIQTTFAGTNITLLKIGQDVEIDGIFSLPFGLRSLTKIYYEGTSRQWEERDFSAPSSVRVYFAGMFPQE